jgi:hypothetical protein
MPGIVPPGDLRMALTALADPGEHGTLWSSTFQHRFRGEGALAGHPVGNLVLVGLTKVLGDPVAAYLGGFVGSALGGATIGLAAGALQWIALQRLGADPGMWIVASTVGWGVGWLLIGSIDESSGAPGVSGYLLGSAGAALAGVITGVSVLRLLRTRAPAQP